MRIGNVSMTAWDLLVKESNDFDKTGASQSGRQAGGLLPAVLIEAPRGGDKAGKSL